MSKMSCTNLNTKNNYKSELHHDMAELNLTTSAAKPSLEYTFGKYCELPRVGRRDVLSTIWKKFIQLKLKLQISRTSANKREACFVHASPGMGKTYLLRELYKKKEDSPYELSDHLSSADFLVFDFNRNACVQ